MFYYGTYWVCTYRVVDDEGVRLETDDAREFESGVSFRERELDNDWLLEWSLLWSPILTDTMPVFASMCGST